MKKNDILILCLALAVAAVIFVLCLALVGDDGAYAIITVDGEEYARLPLDENTELAVRTAYGENLVAVKDGKVYVKHADCPDKICMQAGEATELLPIVCLPHKLTVTIEE